MKSRKEKTLDWLLERDGGNLPKAKKSHENEKEKRKEKEKPKPKPKHKEDLGFLKNLKSLAKADFDNDSNAETESTYVDDSRPNVSPKRDLADVISMPETVATELSELDSVLTESSPESSFVLSRKSSASSLITTNTNTTVVTTGFFHDTFTAKAGAQTQTPTFFGLDTANLKLPNLSNVPILNQVHIPSFLFGLVCSNVLVVLRPLLTYYLSLIYIMSCKILANLLIWAVIVGSLYGGYVLSNKTPQQEKKMKESQNLKSFKITPKKHKSTQSYSNGKGSKNVNKHKARSRKLNTDDFYGKSLTEELDAVITEDEKKILKELAAQKFGIDMKIGTDSALDVSTDAATEDSNSVLPKLRSPLSTPSKQSTHHKSPDSDHTVGGGRNLYTPITPITVPRNGYGYNANHHQPQQFQHNHGFSPLNATRFSGRNVPLPMPMAAPSPHYYGNSIPVNVPIIEKASPRFESRVQTPSNLPDSPEVYVTQEDPKILEKPVPFRPFEAEKQRIIPKSASDFESSDEDSEDEAQDGISDLQAFNRVVDDNASTMSGFSVNSRNRVIGSKSNYNKFISKANSG